MLIIIEGIDRVGKTTLCNKLKEELGFPIFKEAHDEVLAVRSDEMIMNYGSMKTLINLEKVIKFNAILDRFDWSERIYGQLSKGYDNIYFDKLIKHSLEEIKDDIVYVYVEPTNLTKSSREHGSSLKKHKEAFDKAYEECKFKKAKCNYNSINNVVFAIKSYCNNCNSLNFKITIEEFNV